MGTLIEQGNCLFEQGNLVFEKISLKSDRRRKLYL